MLLFPTGLGLIPLAALGLSPADIVALVALFTQMPEHVANGVSNALPQDDPEQVTATAWQQRGSGLSVAPDDTMLSWQAPGGDADGLLGPYGSTDRKSVV